MNPARPKKAIRSEQWSLYDLSSRSNPRGSRECLERALAELGPLDSEHDDKLRYWCPCATCAEKAVVLAAQGFNAYEAAIDGAPRKKEVIKQLLDVAEAVRNAAAKLEGLNNHSRKILRDNDELDFVDPFPARYDDVALEDLPRPDIGGKKGETGSFVQRLVALADHAEFCVRNIERISHTGAGDKGGRTNLMRDQLGPTAARLVVQCWKIFHNGRKVQGTASENGPFIRFLNAVYEFATGEVEESSTLLNWAKRLAKKLRNFSQLDAGRKFAVEQIELLLLSPKSYERDFAIAELLAAGREMKTGAQDVDLEIRRIINAPRQRTSSK